ncbi:MAG TPA: cache domain-containing protein [Blastocatellia bacterium]|nr:cache domain-containing protein [Blastocatellia bacterium]
MGERISSPRIKRFSIIGFTLIIVVIPFCLYYLFFVTSQTTYFSQRNFRVLSGIGDHISSKIDNLAANLVNVAEKAKQKVESKQPAKPVAVAEKVQKAATLVPDFKFDPKQYEQVKAPTTERGVIFKRSSPRSVPNSNAAASNRNTSPPAASSHVAAPGKTRPAPAAARAKGSDSPVTLSVKPERGSFWLYLEYQGSANALPANIPVKSDLNTLFEPFVSRYVLDELNETKERLFDEVLVAEQETGRVIFERGPSGLNVVALDNLLTNKGEKLELKLSDQSSSVVTVQLAGTDYKLFLQPVRLTVFAKGDNEKQGVRWVVCGLTRTAHFRDETFAVSYTVLIFFVFGVLLAVLSWPLLKLKLMGPKDRLRRADLGLTVVSALLGTAIIAFLLLDLHTYLSLEDTLDGQLEDFSTKIKSNFRQELRAALAQLEKLNDEILNLPPEDQTEATKELKDPRRATSTPSRSTNGGPPSLSARSNILGGGLDWRTAPYPYFNNATWTDPDGQQRIKWTTWPDTTTFVNVSDRQFFKDARDAKTWTLKRDDKDDTKHYEYSFELLKSKNTGENLAIISTKVPGSTWVSNLDSRLLSLMGTVLPVGFGYAVIDASGRVLLHSDELKNLEEQFFAECENDRSLRAAVMSRADRFMNTKYLGEGHRLYVSPLSGTPWMLVVFRDKQVARTINLELLTLAMVLYLGFAAIMFGLISVIYLPKRGERISWLWPDPNRAGQYELLIAANLVIGGIFVLALTVKSGWFLITCCVTIPVLATILGTLVLRKSEHVQAPDSDISGSGRFLSYRTGYALAFAGFVALVSMLPPIGFFEVARNFELRLMIKHGQVSLARALEHRDQRVASQYASVKIGEPSPQALDQPKRQHSKRQGRASDPPDQSVAKLDFLARRKDPGQTNLDVYESFFFGTTRGPAANKFADEQLTAVDWLLARVRPLYNQSCLESQELFNGASSDLLWRWKLDGEGHIRLEKDKEGREGDPSVALTSSLPEIVAPNTFWRWMGLIAAIALLLLLIHGLVRFVARRFFLLDMDLPNSTALPGSYVLLRDLVTDNGKAWNAEQYCVADLSLVKDWPAWRNELMSKATGASLPVVLDHFEHSMDDPAANTEKLKAIEHLLESQRQVVVVSTVDPMCFSLEPKSGRPVAAGNGDAGNAAQPAAAARENAEAPDDEVPEGPPCGSNAEARSRWTTVFTSLPTVFAPEGSTAEFLKANPHFLSLLKTRRPWRYIEKIGQGIVGNGTGRRHRYDRPLNEEQISQVVEQARPLHQALWRGCTEGQRCTLIQLAQDGLLSPKNKHLRRLVKRGLIVRDPELRLMDESFRRFVISMSREQDIESWRQQEGGSAWQLMKAPLLLVLIGVALFLFVTQKDVYDSTISLLSAVTAGIAALFKLLGMFQKGQRGAADAQ